VTAPRLPIYLLWTPALRSAHAERLRPLVDHRLVLAATGRHADWDDAARTTAAVEVVESELAELVARVRAEPPAVLEVTEPLWRAQWGSALRLIEAAGGRSRVVSYAIDELAGVGEPVDAGALDALAFGTAAAAAAYERTFPTARWRSRVTPERRARCARCFPADATAAPAEREVVLAAELSVRKGVDLLLEAWTSLGAAAQGWRLRLLGWGPLVERARVVAAGRDDLEVAGLVDRAQVHDALRRAAVVVLASRRVEGWREQVGLSLVEGLAHGCRLVTTTETGLAAGLAAQGHEVVRAGDAAALAAGLGRAMGTAGPRTPLPDKVLPPAGTDSRHLATRWLAGEPD